MPTADPATRTFIAKVKLGLPGLKSGMFGRGTINAGNAVKNILVPKRAIVERGALNIVWVIDQNNIAHMRILKPSRTVGDRMEVLAGLSDGERIATDGLAKMVDGAKLQ